MNRIPRIPIAASVDTGGGAAPGGVAVSDPEYNARLWDEYKMLQDKIDKIGAFRFTIKGWSVTAVVAAVAAVIGKSLSVCIGVAVGLDVMLMFFFWFECEQLRSSRIFGERALRIEIAFSRLHRGMGKDATKSFPAPYTAHEISLAGVRRRTGTPTARGRNRGVWNMRWRFARQAHLVFYLSLVLLAFLPLIPQHRAIHSHWNSMTKKFRLPPQRNAPKALTAPPTKLPDVGPGKTP